MAIQSSTSSFLQLFPSTRAVSIKMSNLARQNLLNSKLENALQKYDLFQAYDLLNDGADPNTPVRVVKEMFEYELRGRHPQEYIYDICDDTESAYLFMNVNSTEILSKVKQIRQKITRGEQVPSSLVKECMVATFMENAKVKINDFISPLHLAILLSNFHDDLSFVAQLLEKGADVNALRDSKVLEALQLDEFLWGSDLDLRQLLIDHGISFAEMIQGQDLKELIFKCATGSMGIDTLKFIAQNCPEFKALINEKDEEGTSLYVKILSATCHPEPLRFLSECGGDLDLLAPIEESKGEVKGTENDPFKFFCYKG